MDSITNPKRRCHLWRAVSTLRPGVQPNHCFARAGPVMLILAFGVQHIHMSVSVLIVSDNVNNCFNSLHCVCVCFPLYFYGLKFLICTEVYCSDLYRSVYPPTPSQFFTEYVCITNHNLLLTARISWCYTCLFSVRLLLLAAKQIPFFMNSVLAQSCPKSSQFPH